jgi:TRAP-type C4-dicarboxylate transport system substrate-binding protein
MPRPMRALAIAAAFAGVLASPPEVAAQSIELKVADSLPSGHVIHRLLLMPWMDEVQQTTQGVGFKHFPGEQLGKAKDLLTLTQTGVADIGYVVPAYASDKMPLTSAFELPGAFSNLCQGFTALWTLSHGGGFLEQKEFAPNGVVPVLMLMLPTYQILIGADRAIASLKDMEGLKIRSAAGSMEFMVKNLNIVPIRMTPPEVYEGMSRGTIDGAILPYQSAVSYSLDPLLKSGTVNTNFGTVAITYAMAKTRLDALPGEVRKALLDLGEKHTKLSCSKFEAEESQALTKVKAKGMKPIEFTAADLKTLKTVFEKARADWAETLEKRGKPGREAIAAVRTAVAQ